VAKLIQTIRTKDSHHLITVGLLPTSAAKGTDGSGFVPKNIAPDLDFICVHLYPRSGHLQEDLRTLKSFCVGKPVVIEETFLMGCNGRELREFLEKSEQYASGWIGFYWGKTPEELAASTNFADAVTSEWLKIFQEMQPSLETSDPKK